MNWAGFGIAGNFAGHLEQAGEARDFVAVRAAGAGPKGMFPFHLPLGPDHFLSTDPVSDRVLFLPENGEIQPEPEMALECVLEWNAGRCRVKPVAAMAFDDASIRREGAPRISVKKNWGPGSKGASATRIPVDSIDRGGLLDRFRLASWVFRDGAWAEFGEDSPVAGYTLFHAPLLEWIEEKLNGQREEGPLEDLATLLAQAGHPDRALITIGATRYNAFGETLRVKAGDRVAVALYDGSKMDNAAVRALLDNGGATDPTALSLLVREVVAVGKG